ncbi:histidine phosphatase family protein [Salinimonas chungwhensis]|uniref:histidine phosphatase family protein n=1 Tax=Salinimonas chungwhensis TaxID=265425 RepID=UPI00038021E1|nr:histidine phosphatase family protein [Salinimonas chungwhensis]
MTEIYFVRHGQASMGQDDYDVLSPLGHEQAHWLGEYFAEQQLRFDQMLSGTLRRQVDTLDAITAAMSGSQQTLPSSEAKPCFNEFDFMQVIKLFLQQNPQYQTAEPTAKYWFKILKHSMHAWSQNTLSGEQQSESWEDFVSRVRHGMTQCSAPSGQRILIATSGGIIACAVGIALGLDAETIIRLNLQIQNTSITRLYRGKEQWSLHSFNAMPHMSCAARAKKITYA